ncbi:MAG TPA: hypothetical protein VMM82_11770, partial [Spirochaetia bacterium]|nr:hypothetical protein [Spirochaetia bacterium]
RGWVRASAAYAVKRDGTRALSQKCLGEGLALPNQEDSFVIFRDWKGGAEYIRSCAEMWEKGLYAELNAFRCQVFMDFRVVYDDSARRWSRLCGELQGRGVPSMDRAVREMDLRPVRDSFAALLESAFPKNALEKHQVLLDEIERFAPIADRKQILAGFRALVEAAPTTGTDNRAHAFLWLWTVIRPLCPEKAAECPALSWIDEWLLGDIMRGFLVHSSWSDRLADPAPGMLALLVRTGERITEVPLWPELLADPAAERFLEVNKFEGVRWFSKESIEVFVSCLAEICLAEGWKMPDGRVVLAAAEASGYRWADFLELLRPKNADPGLKDSE